MPRPLFQFEWDEVKAVANLRRHDVSFELASSVFLDPRILTVADVIHSDEEERWISMGIAANGAILTVVHLWSEQPPLNKIRLISARQATKTEIGYYQGEV